MPKGEDCPNLSPEEEDNIFRKKHKPLEGRVISAKYHGSKATWKKETKVCFPAAREMVLRLNVWTYINLEN